MTIQLASDVSVRLVRESTTGTAALVGATPCHVIRITDSPGLELKRAQVQSKELRNDLTSTLMRLAGKSVDGSYNGELTVGGATDMIIESVMRSTWVAASTPKFTCDAGAAHTSLAFTANTVTLAGTDTWATTHGVRVGDVCYCGAVGATIDNIKFMVASIDATDKIITTVGSPLAVVGADTNATFNVLKKVTTPTTPTRYSHTIEQYDENTDLSELYLGCRVTGFRLSAKPGEMATWGATFMGMDRTILVVGTSPWFTTPTTTTGLGLIADDSTAWFNAAAAVNITGFDLDFAIGATTLPILGTFVSPDVFDNIMTVKGSITGARTGSANDTLFDAETEFNLGLLLQEPGDVPRGALGVFLPRVKIASLAKPAGGSTGPKIETMAIEAAVKVAATGYDATIANFTSSAA